jgi:hypothetical protein
MKDFNTIFIDSLKEITGLLERRDFESAFKSIAPLTHYSNFSGDAQGVLITEVLEGVFNQVGPIVDTFQIPDEEIQDMVSNLLEAYNKLIIALFDKNKLKIFDALVSIRFIATQFQLKWTKIGKQKVDKKKLQTSQSFEEMMKRIMTR